MASQKASSGLIIGVMGIVVCLIPVGIRFALFARRWFYKTQSRTENQEHKNWINFPHPVPQLPLPANLQTRLKSSDTTYSPINSHMEFAGLPVAQVPDLPLKTVPLAHLPNSSLKCETVSYFTRDSVFVRKAGKAGRNPLPVPTQMPLRVPRSSMGDSSKCDSGFTFHDDVEYAAAEEAWQNFSGCTPHGLKSA